MSKPFPDFSAPEFRFRSGRSRLYALREYVLCHDGPIPKTEVLKLFSEVCQVSVELLQETKIIDHWSMDANESERLLRETIALLEPAAA